MSRDRSLVAAGNLLRGRLPNLALRPFYIWKKMGEKKVNLWQRIKLIEQVNYNYHYKYFKQEFTDSFWAWFCLVKVNVCLFFGWQSIEDPGEDSDFEWSWGLAYFDEEERTEDLVPIGSWDWKEICIPCSVLYWYFGIGNNSNY